MNTECTILIVDDFPGWRAKVRDILASRPEWKIIGEASDGQEAIAKATELQPDLVMLDVGLPTLNGIEVAKIIRQKFPKIRIIFVSQNSDDEIIEAATSAGAASYVLKPNVRSQLVDAITKALSR